MTSFFPDYWCTVTSRVYAWNTDHINSLLQVPCDASQRMETTDPAYDWERRSFPGDGCVPFAGLAILLWPFAVVGAVLASILSSVPLGAYGAVVAYQVW